MTTLQVLPAIAYLGCIALVLWIATGRRTPTKGHWTVPAAVGAAFLLFSLATLAEDGLRGFWINHTSNLSGNQVWFDLLLAVTIAFYLIAPRARAVGMPLIPWAIAVILTACVALLPMLARLVWLERKQTADPR